MLTRRNSPWEQANKARVARENANIVAGSFIVPVHVEMVYRARLRFDIVSGSYKQSADDGRVNRIIEAAERRARKLAIECRGSDGLGMALRNAHHGGAIPWVEFIGEDRDAVVKAYRQAAQHVARYDGHVFPDARKDGTS